jgi:superfamily I DNA/RNA helicase
LWRKWGKECDRVIIAGDDQQALYGFRGATPDAFLNPPIPDENKRFLEQSYRVPRAVHAAAVAWGDQIVLREPKTYLPRDEEGEVLASNRFRYAEPRQLCEYATQQGDEGRTVMILGSCSYMLSPIISELRSMGASYWNPYRTTRGDWNPLTPSTGVSASRRLLSYLAIDEDTFGDDARPWTGADLKCWVGVVKASEVLARGSKAKLDALPDDEIVSHSMLDELFLPEALAKAVPPDLSWFTDSLLAARRSTMEYPVRVLAKHGAKALIEDPKIVVGTIHSTKGAEADVVILLPDLSMNGFRQWSGESTGLMGRSSPSDERDAVRRLFYVGMTRARETLVLCSPSGSTAVPPYELAPGVRFF